MDSEPTVFKGTHRSQWTFFAFAVSCFIVVSLCVTIWPDFPRSVRPLTPWLLVVAIYRVATAKDYELVLEREGFFVRRGKRIVQSSPWDRVDHFEVSPTLRKVGWVLKPPKPDPRATEPPARSPRRPVYRLLSMVSGVDRVLVCRHFRGISNEQLATVMNKRQSLDHHVQQYIDREAWPVVTGRYLAENWVMHTLKEEGGRVRLEDALGVLGALAGYSIIAALHRMAGGTRENLQRSGLMVIGTENGTEYYFGDLLNAFLIEDPIQGLYEAACEPLRKAGRPVPDPMPLVQRIASSVGSDQYGIPDLPPEHRVRYRPVDVVNVLWPAVYRAAALDERDPTTWTISFLHAIRVLNEKSPGMIDDAVRAQIVMECAFPTAHLDPDTVLEAAA